jgi:predicted CoA-binding protein
MTQPPRRPISLKPSDQEIADLLSRSKTIAIVGASDSPERPVYGVSQWLLDNTDYQLFFVNPRLDSLFGFPVYPTLMDIPEWVDIVDVFRKSADVPSVLDDAIAARATALWMQLGVSDDASVVRGNKAGLDVVQDLCIKVEYQRLRDLIIK